jgi:hypothetical protein
MKKVALVVLILCFGCFLRGTLCGQELGRRLGEVTSNDTEYVFHTVELREMKAKIAISHPKLLRKLQDGYYHPEVTFELLSSDGNIFAHAKMMYITEENGKQWFRNGGMDSVVLKIGKPTTSKYRFSFEDAKRLYKLEAVFTFYDDSKRNIGPQKRPAEQFVIYEYWDAPNLKVESSNQSEFGRIGGDSQFRVVFYLK